jgi:hypothetical protein
MLSLADHWLRAELDERRKSKKRERAAGEFAVKVDPTLRQGGYASGRNIDTTLKPKTETYAGGGGASGRLSDMLGNAGVTLKHA